MTDTALDLDACAREPIHIPEAIQPHGFVMVLDRSDLTIRRVGGDIEGLAGVEDWQGAPVSDVLGAGRAAQDEDDLRLLHAAKRNSGVWSERVANLAAERDAAP